MERMEVEAAKKKLSDAIEIEDVAIIQEMLIEIPNILHEVSFTCSRNLVYMAMIYGQTAIVAEVLDTHPRLARDLDSKNLSLLHIAAAQGSVEIAKKLLSIAPETRWWRDCHDMNPVHLAAMNGHVGMLMELLRLDSFPAMERAHRGQTVLHLCVKHGQLGALMFLVEMLGELVHVKDDDGETILHLAIKCNKLENIRYKVVRERARNYLEIERILKIYSKEPIIDILPKLSATTMVVVVLIATMAFQAAVSPPGGVWQDDTSSSHRAGNAVMATTHPKIYKHFVRANTTAFISSLIAIFLITTGQPSARVHFMLISLFATWVSLASIAVSYGASVKVVTPNTETHSLIRIIIAVVSLPVGMLGFIYVYSSIRKGYLSWTSNLRRRQDLITDSQLRRALHSIFRWYEKMVIVNLEVISNLTPMTRRANPNQL